MAISPMIAATLVAVSRYQDFKHHWEGEYCSPIVQYFSSSV